MRFFILKDGRIVSVTWEELEAMDLKNESSWIWAPGWTQWIMATNGLTHQVRLTDKFKKLSKTLKK